MSAKSRKQKRLFGGIAAAAVVALIGASVAFGRVSDNKGTVNLAYVEWDTEVASTHVVAEVLKEMGYEVKTTPLDNAIMWESVAKGEVDGMVAAWLPSTHQAQYEQYKDQVENLGPNLEGAKLGIAVPSYMAVDSIADLSDEAGKTITELNQVQVWSLLLKIQLQHMIIFLIGMWRHLLPGNDCGVRTSHQE